MEPSLEDLARDNAALAASLEHQESNPSPRPASRNSLFDDLDLDNSRARQPDTLDKPNSTSQPETVRLTEPELSRPEQQPDPAKVKEKEELLNELKLLRQQVNRHERVAERIERGGKDSGIQDSTVVELV